MKLFLYQLIERAFKLWVSYKFNHNKLLEMNLCVIPSLVIIMEKLYPVSSLFILKYRETVIKVAMLANYESSFISLTTSSFDLL